MEPKHSCLGLLRCPKLSPYPYPPQRVWGLFLALLCPILAALSGCSVHPWALQRALHASVRPREVGVTVENQQLISLLKWEGHGKFSRLSPSLYSLLWPALTWGYLCWLWPPTGHPRFKKNPNTRKPETGQGILATSPPWQRREEPAQQRQEKGGSNQKNTKPPGRGKKGPVYHRTEPTGDREGLGAAAHTGAPEGRWHGRHGQRQAARTGSSRKVKHRLRAPAGARPRPINAAPGQPAPCLPPPPAPPPGALGACAESVRDGGAAAVAAVAAGLGAGVGPRRDGAGAPRRHGSASTGAG